MSYSVGALFYARLRALVGTNEYERIGREDGAGHKMVAKVWSRLPDDILQLVLCRLPPRSQHRFRCVSKHWKELLLTLASTSQQGCDGRQPQLYGISVVCTRAAATGTTQVAAEAACHQSSYEELSVCKDDEDKEMVRRTPSLRLDLSFLLPMFGRWYGWDHYQFAVDSGWVVVMDARGWPLTPFCVFNPVTRNWRQLPPLSNAFPGRLVDASVHVDGNHGLQLLVALHLDMKPVFARFSANTNAWKVYSSHIGSSLFCSGELPLNWIGVCRDVICHLASGDWQGNLFVHVSHMCEAGLEIVEAIRVPQSMCTQKRLFLACHAGDPYIVLTEDGGYTTEFEVWKVQSHPDLRDDGNTIASKSWKHICTLQLANGECCWVDEMKVVGNYICLEISGVERAHRYVYSTCNDSWQVFPARFRCFTPTTDILQ